MKPIWDSEIVRALLRSRLFNLGWQHLRPSYHKFMKDVLYRDGVPVNLDGRQFKVCYEQRRHAGLPPKSETDWMLSTIQPGATVLDIGASDGCVSVLFGQAVGATGKVYAFEPSPAPFELLRKNAAVNGLSEVIEPFNLAIGSSIGTLDFFINDDPADMTHSAIASPGQAATKRAVPALTLDVFCLQYSVKPDVIKVDVEGFEPHVLAGARGLISDRPETIWLIELHPWLWPNIGYDANRVFALIDNLGLRAVDQDGKPVRGVSDRLHVKLIAQ